MSVDSLNDRVAAALRDQLAASLEPGLYLVSTPIGNLADISLRALAVLGRADRIYCEDTRHTRKLMSHYGIGAELRPYHEHNAVRVRPEILARLASGASLALVSDAGTPLLSDPGYKLVREAAAAGGRVFSIPGASAPIAALTSSAMPTDHFYFEGFLPGKREARRKRLELLRTVPATLVFFEAPSRLEDMLRDLAHGLGNRDAAIAKELTKLHETVVRAPLEEISERLRERTQLKGEFVVVVAPPAPGQVSDRNIRDALASAMAGSSLRDAVRDVATVLEVPRKRVYAIGLELADGS